MLACIHTYEHLNSKFQMNLKSLSPPLPPFLPRAHTHIEGPLNHATEKKKNCNNFFLYLSSNENNLMEVKMRYTGCTYHTQTTH